MSVVVAGSGPAGATLATLLARQGIETTLFSGGKRPEMIVGESLIPSLIPLMRRLGIEQEVAGISQLKPGATFVWQEDWPVPLSFDAVEGILPTYAYNVPRPAFDELLERRARRGGVRWVDGEAGFRKAAAGSGREAELTPETLELAPHLGGKQPDLVVDATGRRRSLARLLDIPARVGGRKDMALFAHYSGWKHEGPQGQIIISRRTDNGWNWQIPLKDCVSVGAVLHSSTAMLLGKTPEERLEAAIGNQPLLERAAADRRRISEVAVYTNYQLISERGAGHGWVSLGDAFGFVDPMLSPGLWIAMHGAETLAGTLSRWRGPGPVTKEFLAEFESETIRMLEAWQALVQRFYDGSIMASYATGGMMRKRLPAWIANVMERHIQRNFAGMACGIYTQRAYSRKLMDFLCTHTRGHQAADYAIR